METPNTRTNYGATRHARHWNRHISTRDQSVPPPYPGFAPPVSLPQHDDRPLVDPASSPLLRKRYAPWMNIPFTVLLTFIATACFFMSTTPITYCNDPADPQVRERIREEWSKEFLEHEQRVAEREVVKAQWAWEDERHAARLREWEQERVQHEKELRERAQREEEERLALELFWNRVEAHQCKTYGTREYSAVLMNLPMSWSRRVEACMATPLEVHGIQQLPTSCEDRGHGLLIGRWEISEHEPDCNTFWNWYKDKESSRDIHSVPVSPSLQGCTSPGSRKRRIEHYLENLPKGADWREFCATTPARFRGLEFPGAQECFQWNWGTYGHWQIDDFDC